MHCNLCLNLKWDDNNSVEYLFLFMSSMFTSLSTFAFFFTINFHSIVSISSNILVLIYWIYLIQWFNLFEFSLIDLNLKNILKIEKIGRYQCFKRDTKSNVLLVSVPSIFKTFLNRFENLSTIVNRPRAIQFPQEYKLLQTTRYTLRETYLVPKKMHKVTAEIS